MGEHEKYGGSTIELTSLCPGSAKARAEIGETESGPSAKRGTRIHERIEVLFKDPNSRAYLEKEDEELIANGVLTTLLETAGEHGILPSDIEVEKKVMFGTDAGGKLDYGAYRVFDNLFVADCKSGFNQIEAESNLQLLFYGISYLKSLDPFVAASLKDAHFIILQPDTDPPYEVRVRKWTIPIEELRAYEGYFKSIIDKAEANPDLRTAGDHCEAKYCPARATCPAYRAYLNEGTQGDLIRMLEGEQASPGRGARLAEQLAVLPLIKKWCAAVEADALLVLKQDPTGIPGWTLREGMGNRVWKDEKLVVKYAKSLGLKPDDYSPRELIGPKPFEDLLKSKKIEGGIESLTERPNIGAKLVKAQETKTIEQVFA